MIRRYKGFYNINTIIYEERYMSYRERKEKILDLLDLNGDLSYEQFVISLNVSEATVRRDLEKMNKENLIIRYWGGAKRNPSRVIRQRSILDSTVSDEVRFIGEYAGNLVKDKEFIFIGSGLTTLAMIDYIKPTNISVVTNGIPQAEALKRKGINAFLLGGFIKEYSRAIVGEQTVSMLKSYSFDKSFIGVNGISGALDLLSADHYEYEIKKAAINRSKNNYILATHEKFLKTAMFSLSSNEYKNTMIISDKPMFKDSTWTRDNKVYIHKIKK